MLSQQEFDENLNRNLKMKLFLKTCGNEYLISSNYRKTGMFYKRTQSWWYDFQRIGCPLCNKKGHCSVNIVSGQIICYNCDTFNNKKGIKLMNSQAWRFNIVSDQIPYVAPVNHEQVLTNNINNVPLVSDKQADMVYRALMKGVCSCANDRLTKDDKHDLFKRGLDDESIHRHMFIDKQLITITMLDREHHGFDSNIKTWLQQANLPLDSWRGVAGFYQWQHQEKQNDEIVNKKTILFNMAQSRNIQKCYLSGFENILPKQEHMPLYFSNDQGYLIPVTNLDNQIVAFQIRHLNNDENQAKYTWVSSANNDDNGVSPQAPVNVAMIPSLDRSKNTDQVKQWLFQKNKTVILTEGILKSIVSAELLEKRFHFDTLAKLGAVVLGNGGVAMYHKFIPMLAKLHAVNVLIAYDMDYHDNLAVRKATNSLISCLKQHGYHVGRLFWEKEKGLDDCLLSNQPLSVHFY